MVWRCAKVNFCRHLSRNENEGMNMLANSKWTTSNFKNKYSQRMQNRANNPVFYCNHYHCINAVRWQWKLTSSCKLFCRSLCRSFCQLASSFSMLAIYLFWAATGQVAHPLLAHPDHSALHHLLQDLHSLQAVDYLVVCLALAHLPQNLEMSS